MVGAVLRHVFSFRGELDRKGYALGVVAGVAGLFVGCIALFLIVALAQVGLLWIGLIEKKMYFALNKAWISLDLIIFMIASIWMFSALAVKRARSFGVSAVVSLPLCLMLGPVDRLVLRGLTEARFVWPFADMTPLGGTLIAILFILLFAWPPGAGLARQPSPAV